MRRDAQRRTWLRGRRGPWALMAVVLALAACTPEPPEERGPSPDANEAGSADPAPEPSPDPERAEDPDPPDPPEEEPSLGRYGVSAGDEDAVAAGMQILRAGGNAVDAAVATAVAVSVVEPFASGVGGGGAALIAGPGMDPIAYDYREVVAADGRIPASNIGIPGFVAGMARLQQEHGALDLDVLLEPAIALAREGTSTSATVAAQLRNAAYRLPVGELPHLFPDGSALATGDPLVQEDLAETLEVIGEDGPEALYTGRLADTLAEEVTGIDAASLAAYEVQRSRPPSGPFAGLEVVGAAPPLPGVALIQMLQIAEALDVAAHEPGSAGFVHRLAMAWRAADQTVTTDLGDPDFVDVPVAELTSPTENAELAAAIPMDRLLAVDPSQPRGGLTGNTTHLTVVDGDGMMVSMTNTLTNFWGTGQYSQGFFLNDQLGRFSIGRHGANVPEPGRRSVSWSLPAMVLDQDGRPVLGLGSPGGRRIPLVLTQTLVRWALHDQPLSEAVAAPRFHLEGSELLFEELPPPDVAADLRQRGYASLSVPPQPHYFGSVQALEADHDVGAVIGAQDTRREAAFEVGSP